MGEGSDGGGGSCSMQGVAGGRDRVGSPAKHRYGYFVTLDSLSGSLTI